MVLMHNLVKYTLNHSKNIPEGTMDSIHQRSPTFLAPGTGFVEDNLSMDCGGGGGWFRR